MEQEDVVTVNYKGDIAIITLNRPAKLNALNSDHYYLLGERLREVDKRDDIFITVVTGKGRYFSALVILPFLKFILALYSTTAANSQLVEVQMLPAPPTPYAAPTNDAISLVPSS